MGEDHDHVVKMVVPTKAKLRDKVTPTLVISALVGGFALANLRAQPTDTNTETVTYLLLVMAVHACTCSALTSAFLLREINHKTEEAAGAWAGRHPLLLQFPFYKFGMGCIAYLVSVILMTYETLRERTAAQWISVIVGLMSTSTVVGTAIILALDNPNAVEKTMRVSEKRGSTLVISNEAGALTKALGGEVENGVASSEMVDTQIE